MKNFTTINQYASISKNKSFTLLEVIVAIFVLTVGLGATIALIQQTLVSTSLAKDKLIASYLAQEGMELARAQRDNNWLEKRTNPTKNWDDNLATGCWCVNWWPVGWFQCLICQFIPLSIDSNGFYGYPLFGGTPTKFYRTITISDKTATSLKITSTVTWKERNRTHTVTASEYLYNWYEK